MKEISARAVKCLLVLSILGVGSARCLADMGGTLLDCEMKYGQAVTYDKESAVFVRDAAVIKVYFLNEKVAGLNFRIVDREGVSDLYVSIFLSRLSNRKWERTEAPETKGPEHWVSRDNTMSAVVSEDHTTIDIQTHAYRDHLQAKGEVEVSTTQEAP